MIGKIVKTFCDIPSHVFSTYTSIEMEVKYDFENDMVNKHTN